MDKIEYETKIDWQSFLAKQNLVWDAVKYRGGHFSKDYRKVGLRRYYHQEWDDGAFIGNGMTGAMIYKEAPDVYKFELGRNDVIAHNLLEGVDFAKARVPIGDFVMKSEDGIVKDTMLLDLYSAKVSGVIHTASNQFKWQVFNHATKDLMVIDISSETTVEGVLCGFRPKHGVSPRINFASKNPEFAALPPEPVQIVKNGINMSVQTFLKEAKKDTYETEGACTIGWYEQVLTQKHKRVFLAICNSHDDTSSVEEAYKLVDKARRNDIDELIESHQSWWHYYYKKSFLTLSDKKWEKFYWLQIYKLGCAVDEGVGVLDSQGPWLTITPWPTTVWNLNVQLSYMSLYTSNRAELAESLIKTLKMNEQVLIDNAKPMGIDNGMYMSRATTNNDFYCLWPDTYELGNLTWALHNVWRHYSVTLDPMIVHEVLFPFLKANINCYLAMIVKDVDGKYHIPNTSSPEYESAPKANWCPIMDCNYTIALFRWGLERLLELNERYGLSDELEDQWREVLDNLVEFQVNENGFMVGSEIGFDLTHRHFSHMLMVHPLCMLDVEDENDLALIKKSLDRWLSLAGKLQGYTFTGAASIAAYIGEGDKALEYLNGLEHYITFNTMYSELGPVIETPLSAAESIHHMMIQSNHETIKLFPAMPEAWQDAEFKDFLAEGGYKVSAKYEKGRFISATIESTLAGRVKVCAPGKNMVIEMKAGECQEVSAELMECVTK